MVSGQCWNCEMNLSNLHNVPEFEKLNDSSMDESMVTYSSEAKFAIKILFDDLAALNSKSCLLEIGSGIGLLSHQIALSGLSVTSLEPSSQGFEGMKRLQEYVSTHPGYRGLKNIKKIEKKFENFQTDDKFDYIFCFNVLEHVEKPKDFIDQAVNLLSEGGVFRLICPNYNFPYEGHFNVPILINKSFTQKIFAKKIISMGIQNPNGLWESLNWISHTKIDRILRGKSGLRVTNLSRSTFNAYLHRVTYDQVFVGRKGPLIQKLIPLTRWIFRIIPLKFIPVMDIKILKVGGE